MAQETEIGAGDAEEVRRHAEVKPTLKELLLSPAPRGPLNIPPRRNWKRREPKPFEDDLPDPFTFRR
jgi:hypothetical protein